MTREYGADGFVPTIENITEEQGVLVLETIDGRSETDLVSTRTGLVRRADMMTEHQEDISALER
jgi:hypothetical protein